MWCDECTHRGHHIDRFQLRYMPTLHVARRVCISIALGPIMGSAAYHATVSLYHFGRCGQWYKANSVERGEVNHLRSAFVPRDMAVGRAGCPLRCASTRDMNSLAGRHALVRWLMRPASN